MRRSSLLVIAGGLALAALLALGAWWYGRPVTLRVAVTQDTEDAQLVTAIAQNFAKEHEPIRLRPVLVNGAGASAAALESGNADLAVVRSDIHIPLNGQTLVVLHRNPALLLSTRAARIAQVSELKGQSVGVVRGTATGTGNVRLLEAVLSQYEVPLKDVEVIELTREQVFEALSRGQVAAVFTVGALNSQAMRDVVMAATMAGGGEPVFIPISEARAMAQRAPAFETAEIVRGSFGGSPPKPAQNVETLAVSVRLMAVSTMKDSRAAEVTKLLFQNRPSIALVAPLAHQIEAPATERSAAIPVHPGAAAYLDDEEKTFFDQYSDAIYIGAMLLSILGSAAAALASRMSTSEAPDTDSLMGRLLDVLRAARTAESLDELERLEQETDDILISGVAAQRMHTLNSQAISALSMVLDQARLAIRERRRLLEGRRPIAQGPKRFPLDARL